MVYRNVEVEVLEVFTPVIRASIATAMTQACIAIDENISRDLIFCMTNIVTLNLFSVIIQRAFKFEEQAVIEMETEFDQCAFNKLQGDVPDVIADGQSVCVNQVKLDNANDITKK